LPLRPMPHDVIHHATAHGSNVVDGLSKAASRLAWRRIEMLERRLVGTALVEIHGAAKAQEAAVSQRPLHHLGNGGALHLGDQVVIRPIKLGDILRLG
jgi:hypothetical protein